MKHVLVLLLVFLNCTTLTGQKKYYVKAYHNSDFYQRAENLFDSEAQERLTTNHTISNFNRLSIAIGLANNTDWYHEIELSYSSQSQPFEHESRVSENEELDKLFFSLHYELNRQLISRGNLTVMSGLGVSLYKSKTESTPDLPVFPVTDDYLGATIHLVPRLTYTISDRIGLDLNAKVGLLDIHSYESTVQNVQLPARQQKWVDETNTSILPFTYTLRFGLSYLIK